VSLFVRLHSKSKGVGSGYFQQDKVSVVKGAVRGAQMYY